MSARFSYTAIASDRYVLCMCKNCLFFCLFRALILSPISGSQHSRVCFLRDVALPRASRNFVMPPKTSVGNPPPYNFRAELRATQCSVILQGEVM